MTTQFLLLLFVLALALFALASYVHHFFWCKRKSEESQLFAEEQKVYRESQDAHHESMNQRLSLLANMLPPILMAVQNIGRPQTVTGQTPSFFRLEDGSLLAIGSVRKVWYKYDEDTGIVASASVELQGGEKVELSQLCALRLHIHYQNACIDLARPIGGVGIAEPNLVPAPVLPN